MSYKESKYIELGKGTGNGPPFSAGYVDNVSPYLLKDSQSPYLRNTRLDGLGTIIRPGYQLHKEYTGTYPKGIGSYIRTVPANDRLIVYQNNTLRSIDDNQVSTDCTGITFTSNTRMNFMNIGDSIYCMNGVDPYTKLTGTTLTQPSTGISGFAPSYSVFFNGDVFASGWATNPNYVYKTGTSYDDYSGAGSTQYKFPENITALASTLESLFYFTKNSISLTTKGDLTLVSGIYSYANRSLNVREGATNFNTVVPTGSSVYYLTSTNKIRVIQKGVSNLGYDDIDLSHRKYRGIDNLMNSLDPNQTDGFGYYLPAYSLIKWHLKSYGSAINDVCIVYDIQKDEFFVDTAKYFYGGIQHKDKAFTLSMVEAKVFQDEYSQDDDGTPIEFDLMTKSFNPYGPTLRGEIWESRLNGKINELTELTEEIYLDGQLIETHIIDKRNIQLISGGIGSLPIGVGPIGSNLNSPDMYDFFYITQKGNLQKKGTFLSYRYTCSKIGAKFRLEGLTFKLAQLPPQAQAHYS